MDLKILNKAEQSGLEISRYPSAGPCNYCKTLCTKCTNTDPAVVFMACLLWRGPDGEYVDIKSNCDGDRSIRLYGVHGLEDDFLVEGGDAAEALATAAMTVIILYMERAW